MSTTVRTAPISGVDLSVPGAVPAMFAALRARFGDATMGPEDDDAGPGSDEQPGGGQGDAAAGQSQDGGRGYPEGTPWRDMTTEQQVAYWRESSQKHESRAKARGDYDDVKAKADAYDQHVAASATDQEKAVTAALAQGRSEALAEANTRVSMGMLRAALAARGRTGDDADGLLEAVNPASFIAGDDVDTDKVAAWVARVAGPVKVPDLGQGTRTSNRASGVAAGKAAYAEAKEARSRAS